MVLLLGSLDMWLFSHLLVQLLILALVSYTTLAVCFDAGIHTYKSDMDIVLS